MGFGFGALDPFSKNVSGVMGMECILHTFASDEDMPVISVNPSNSLCSSLSRTLSVARRPLSRVSAKGACPEVS